MWILNQSRTRLVNVSICTNIRVTKNLIHCDEALVGAYKDENEAKAVLALIMHDMETELPGCNAIFCMPKPEGAGK